MDGRLTGRGPSATAGARLAPLAIAVSAALYGTITVGGRYFADQGFSLLEISLTAVLFGSLVLGAIVLLYPRLRPRSSELGFFVLFGAAGAALQVTQFAGIVLGVPVGMVAVLLYTQPVWTVILGRLWLQEAITRAKAVAVVLAILGTLVLFDPFDAAASYPLSGVAAALLAGVALSLWVLFARASGLRGNAPVTTAFGYMSFSVLWLLAVYPMLRIAAPDPVMTRIDPTVWVAHWPAVATYTVVAGLLPVSLAMWGMRRIEASTAGVLLVFEPVSAVLLAYAFFDEPLTGRLALGGALIVIANAVLLRGMRRGGAR